MQVHQHLVSLIERCVITGGSVKTVCERYIKKPRSASFSDCNSENNDTISVCLMFVCTILYVLHGVERQEEKVLSCSHWRMN